MKNKSILIVIIMHSMYLPIFGSNPDVVRPSYWQQMKNFIAESSVGRWWRDGAVSDSVGRKRLQSVASSSWTGFKRGALIGAIAGGTYGLSRAGSSPENYIISLLTMGVGALAYNVIDEAFNAYNKGNLSGTAVVDQIKKVINDTLLIKCRTNEEKSQLLANRDFFIGEFKKSGKTDEELESQKKLIDQALDELKKQISDFH